MFLIFLISLLSLLSLGSCVTEIKEYNAYIVPSETFTAEGPTTVTPLYQCVINMQQNILQPHSHRNKGEHASPAP